MTVPRLSVDFNSADDERTVRLNTRGTLDALRAQGLALQEGMEILVTDDEMFARARVDKRDGVWVAVIIAWVERPL